MPNFDKEINILGTTWKVITSDSGKNPILEEADGYCDGTLKECVIKNIIPTHDTAGNLEEHRKRITRHEIIHAFLFECGLSSESWAANEEIVDWIARQFPKLLQVFSELGVL